MAILTIAEREQLEATARAIRARWLVHRDLERGKVKAELPAPGAPGYALAKAMQDGKPSAPPTNNPEKAVANYLAEVRASGREPGPQDVPMIAALQADTHAPMIFQSRERRREYKRWLANKRYEDVYSRVMNGPPKPNEF